VSHPQANARLIFLGMLHAGVKKTHVNNLLAAINVPFAHHKTLKRTEWEAGKGLESLARKPWNKHCVKRLRGVQGLLINY